MEYIKRIVCVLLMGVAGFKGYAQNVEVGLIGGGAGYIGDLNPDNLFKISGVSAGAFVKFHLDPYWNIGIHYNYGRIAGADSTSSNAQFKVRNLSFRTPINEFSVQGEFNFFDYFAGGGRSNFSPYIFAGLGGFIFNPKYRYLDTWQDLPYFRTEGQKRPYRQYGITIPYGVGAKMRIGENWSLFGQVGYRATFTDYLDDVSGYYSDPASWDPNEPGYARRLQFNNIINHGDPNTQRGDFRKRDTYMFVGIGISFTFVSQKCYTF